VCALFQVVFFAALAFFEVVVVNDLVERKHVHIVCNVAQGEKGPDSLLSEIHKKNTSKLKQLAALNLPDRGSAPGQTEQDRTFSSVHVGIAALLS
jgi:hypothetical protein